MVFRDAFLEPKIKVVEAGFDSQGTFSLQNCVESQAPMCFNEELELSQQDLQSLAFILLSKNANPKDVGKGLLALNQIQLKEMRAAVMDRNGGNNHDGQASDDSFLPGLNEDTALDILAWTCRSDYPNLACVNRKFKTLIGSGYLYKLRRRLGVIEHWIYLACISMPWQAFDPVRQRWMRLPTMPCDECFTYADKESLTVGTQLLVFGRELSGFAIWMYSLLSLDWSRCLPMNLPRCLFGSSSLGEIAIVAGGSDKSGRILRSAELYNSEVGSWQTLPDMNLPRKLCSGFYMDGKFYVIGGMSSHTECLSCGEEYNVETKIWRRIENMYSVSSVGHPAMCSPPLVAVVNNQLYSADQATNEVKRYDKINNSWSVVKRLPVRADSSHGWGLAFKACGNGLLVIGGHRGVKGEVVVLHSWNPQDTSMGADEWNVLAIKEGAGAFVSNCAVMGC